MVTKAQIKKFCPSAKPALVAAIVDNWPVAVEAGITGNLRVPHFMAEIATETGGLVTVEENLKYATTKRIMEVWPSRFKTASAASPFVRNAQALAIKVYGGRMGNAAAPSTDGWDFRGGGMLQTTGRENYRKMGFEENPEALRDPTIAFKTALREWTNRGCNAMADRDDVTAIRKAINGGSNGLSDAKKFLVQAKAVFGELDDADMATAEPKKPAPKPTPIAKVDESHLIENVQQLLRDKGYPEVGNVDNKMGSRTRNAILAFEADNGLPITGKVSDALLAALVKAPARQNSAARETATTSDLKQIGVPTVKVGDRLIKFAQGTLGAMGLGAVGQGVTDFDGIKNRLDSIKGLYDTVISLSPWLIGAAVAGAALWFGSKILQEQVEAYRAGRSV